jgi:hypothetical protein
MNSLVLTCAHLSKAVYRLEVPAGMNMLATETIFHQGTNTTGMAYFVAGRIFIAFAGSSIPAHWLSNFKIIKKNCFGWLPAHKGFSECAEAVINTCSQILDAFPDREVVITGHSRGAAVAVLVAAGLKSHARQHGGRKISLVTFAQPRVSQEKLLRAALGDGPYLRVVNGSDAVSRAPKLGYSHAGTLVYLKNGPGYCVDPGLLERFLDRLPTFLQRATDHDMADYIRNLEGLPA